MAYAIVSLREHGMNNAGQFVANLQITFVGGDATLSEDIISVPVTIPGTIAQFPATALAAIVAAVQAEAVANGFTVASGHTLVLITGSMQ